MDHATERETAVRRPTWRPLVAAALALLAAAAAGACGGGSAADADTDADAADGGLDADLPADGDLSADGDADGGERVSLSPADWSEGALEEATALHDESSVEARSAEGREVMIAGTSSALAVRSGYEALLRGGSAADAVAAAAMAQVVLAAGSYVSFGGIFFMVYFDASTGEVSALNAGYDIPAAEDDPATIPSCDSGVPSGRTALVPGFLAGIEAAHERFGTLPFESLFDPAIYFAEVGFELIPMIGWSIAERADVLTRLEPTREIFTDPEGGLYETGDWLTQPALAETLRTVAQGGTETIYRGAWAERLVEAVAAEGGRISLDDMARYEPLWTRPVASSFLGLEVVAPGLPGYGGVDTVEALNLLELSGLAELGHPTESAESFFWLAQILRASFLSYFDEASLAGIVPGLDLSLESRATEETAARLWEAIEAGEVFFALAPPTSGGGHSDALVAVDALGDVAAVVHSANTSIWGATGISVDGVTIPDSACFQQVAMERAGPGSRLPDATDPFLVIDAGRPVLASASVGAALHQRTIAMASNVLSFGMDPAEAQARPALGFPDLATFTGAGIRERVRAGDFPPAVLDGARDLGLEVAEVSALEFGSSRGFWVGIGLDEDGGLRGVASEELNGASFGR